MLLDGNILFWCCSHTHTVRLFKFQLLCFAFISLSRNCTVWFGPCCRPLFHRHDKYKPVVFISVAVWVKLRLWFRTKVITGNCQNKATLILSMWCWSTIRAFTVLWRWFYKLHKCINTDTLVWKLYFQCLFVIVEHAVSISTPWWKISQRWKVMTTPATLSEYHCFHARPAFQWPLMSWWDSTSLHQDRNASPQGDEGGQSEMGCIFWLLRFPLRVPLQMCREIFSFHEIRQKPESVSLTCEIT